MTMSEIYAPIPAQLSYLHQTPDVKARFDRLRARDVILNVRNLNKIYRSGWRPAPA